MRSRFLSRLPKLSQRGVTITEYMFALTLMLLACITTLAMFGENLGCIYFDTIGKADGGFRSAMESSTPSAFDLNGDGKIDDADVALYRQRGCRGPL